MGNNIIVPFSPLIQLLRGIILVVFIKYIFAETDLTGYLNIYPGVQNEVPKDLTCLPLGLPTASQQAWIMFC